ncbi:small acid-soluble spore protein SspI [Paenibacillus sp. SCIV0701]|uniref:Small, acid-soluble spore protein I n=1 Tax=Paenibacillus soyae TaxID=2969249 RepID=A0A9X2MLJ5_9BACL|nr:small acid-soluble spore protein SspI [Paenibacillus soyae]
MSISREVSSLQTIDLRQAIIMRVNGNTKEELKDVIADSIDSDERALPGLGVLFEMIWKEAGQNEQTYMVDSLYRHLHQQNAAVANPSPS